MADKKKIKLNDKEFARDPGFLDRLREGFLSKPKQVELARKRRRARRKAGIKEKKKKPFGS